MKYSAILTCLSLRDIIDTRRREGQGFVIETIINVLPSGVHPFFYRTSAGAEIDSVIEFGLNDCWAVEIKASRTPSLKRGFHMACEDLRVKGKFVVYTGEDKFPIGNDTTVLSLSNFIEAVRKRTHSSLSGNL